MVMWKLDISFFDAFRVCGHVRDVRAYSFMHELFDQLLPVATRNRLVPGLSAKAAVVDRLTSHVIFLCTVDQ